MCRVTTSTAAAQLRWVQGMEKPDPKHTMPWQELLLRRLLGLFADVPTGDGTKVAEEALEFPEAMASMSAGVFHRSATRSSQVDR